MIPPKIGEMSDSIDIVNVKAPYSLDGSGTLVSTHIAGISAKVVPLGGTIEETDQQQLMSRQYYQIWIRSHEGITPFQQIVYDDDRLIMTGPPEDFGAFILLHAEGRELKDITS